MASFVSGNRISQETFDEVVAENVNDFDMPLLEAVKDAVVQFEKQGVDLSNIDVSGGEGREEMLQALAALHSLSIPVSDVEAATSTLNELSALCGKSHTLAQRNLNLVNEKGALNDLLLHLDPKEDSRVLLAVIKLVGELSSSSELLRDFFEPGGSDKLCLLCRELGSNADVLEALLALARNVSRSENNKVALMRAGMGVLLADMLSQSNQSAAVLERACSLIRGLCIHDDQRREMSCAFDNGKFFLKHATVVPTLISLANEHTVHGAGQQVEVASAALAAAKALVTTNDAVQILSLHGINALLLRILRQAATSSDNDSSAIPVSLVRSAVGLLRNIVADDGRKDQLVGEGALELLVHILCKEPYTTDALTVEHGFGCLAQFSLRSPSNSQRIVDSGVAVDLLVRSMRKFFDRDGLQRQACLTIRNIAGRCPDLRPLLLDAGVENVLRDSGRILTCVDEAYSALRDLGVDVQYVKVTEQGTVMPAYEQFGAKSLNFRPVFDETDALDNRIQSEARAPFAAENYSHDHRHHHDDDCDDCCH